MLVDTGPLYAYVDGRDPDHGRCRELLEADPGPLVVPILVVAEVTYLLAERLGADPEVAFLGDLARGALLQEPVRASDWLRIAELVHAYRDFPLGTIDASVVAAAERLGITEIATLDRRHFGAVRPRHTAGFELLP